MVFLKDFSEENKQITKKNAKLPSMQRVNHLLVIENQAFYLLLSGAFYFIFATSLRNSIIQEHNC